MKKIIELDDVRPLIDDLHQEYGSLECYIKDHMGTIRPLKSVIVWNQGSHPDREKKGSLYDGEEGRDTMMLIFE